jgi:hypothetical protein
VDLHERIAAALGWSREQASSFSLAALRDLLRAGGHGKLVDEISAALYSGSHIRGPRRSSK